MGLCIEWLDYAVSLRLLAALLGDGRCAILRSSDAGLFPAQHIEFSHWVCTSGYAPASGCKHLSLPCNQAVARAETLPSPCLASVHAGCRLRVPRPREHVKACART